MINKIILLFPYIKYLEINAIKNTSTKREWKQENTPSVYDTALFY